MEDKTQKNGIEKYEKQRVKQIKSVRHAAPFPLFIGTGQLPDIGIRERQEVRANGDRWMRPKGRGGKGEVTNKKREEERVIKV